MKQFGSHIRYSENLLQVIEHAKFFNLPFFQIFLADKKGKVVRPSSHEIACFRSVCENDFEKSYIHSSYFVNLADVKRDYHPVLVRELALAEQLGINNIVFHAGAVRHISEKELACTAVANALNNVMKRYKNARFLLENSAQGECFLGHDIGDFRTILEKIDDPDRITFCLDTAHAHLAGYDIISQRGYSSFMNKLDDLVSLHRIELIHFNETQQLCGSCKDIHCCIDDKDGQIGITALQRIITDKMLAQTRFLLEMPVVDVEREKQIFELVDSWFSVV